jgi:hypothetical protein
VSPWARQLLIAWQLLMWSGLSVGLGVAMLTIPGFWRGFGLQAVVWGVIDGAIALVAQRRLRRRLAELKDPHAPEVLEAESRKLRRLLLGSAGLDLLYVAVGLLLVVTLGQDDAFARGNGWGVTVQGGFLLLFDLAHGLRLRRRPS